LGTVQEEADPAQAESSAATERREAGRIASGETVLRSFIDEERIDGAGNVFTERLRMKPEAAARLDEFHSLRSVLEKSLTLDPKVRASELAAIDAKVSEVLLDDTSWVNHALTTEQEGDASVSRGINTMVGMQTTTKVSASHYEKNLRATPPQS
jgi:hypothetical protein